jgi:hypothetical protein
MPAAATSAGCEGTLVAIAVYLTHGKIEEPEAARQERAELQAAIEAAEGEERRALEAELMADPVGREPESGLARARLPSSGRGRAVVPERTRRGVRAVFQARRARPVG